MIKVGLTGNFHSGYQEVANLFEQKGMPIFDADVVIKYLLNYSEEHIKKIKDIFGEDIYFVGLLNLQKFDSNEKFDRLFSVIQKDIIKSYEKWRIRNWNHVYTIFKCSVLFERKFDKDMNLNISVFIPQSIRKQEIVNKTQMPITKVDDILSNEMDEYLKNQKSDYVIHNYKSYSDIETQVHHIHKSLLGKGSQQSEFSFPDYNNIMN